MVRRPPLCLAVACPYCGVGPGQGCVRQDGRPAGLSHRDRWLRYEAVTAAEKDIAAGNARESDYFRALTDRGIDPYEPATS